MAEMIVLGALAAFGALCALWLLVGMAFPGNEEGIMLYFWRGSAAGRSFAVRWRLQWELGLFRSRLAVIDLGLTEDDRIFLTRWGRGVEIWETEDGEGTGNYPGRDQRRGVSEL